MTKKKKKKKGGCLIAAGLLLIAAAAAWGAYNLYEAFSAGEAAGASIDYLEAVLAENAAQKQEITIFVPVETPAPKAPETAAPVTAAPETAEPETAAPESAAPATAAPATAEPEAAAPATAAPESAAPEATAPESAAPEAAAPAAAAPATAAPESAAPATAAPEAAAPAFSTPVPVFREEMEIPDYILNPNMDMPTVSHDGQAYIGILEIPAIDLRIPVISEWSYKGLKIAPGRYKGSAYTRDMVICGHNYATHFGYLNRLYTGATVIFTDIDGNRFEYVVEGKETLEAYDIEGMVDSGWDLSLFTCTPGGQYRLTIRCTQRNMPGYF